ncbi:MAG: ATP-grasp domain-containing protein [Eubacteriales bacterium]|nr:ATP-grasp domain-containing protein [Eubacteriales bacterium]
MPLKQLIRRLSLRKKILILGASLAQLPGIQVAQAMGYIVVSCDNLPSSIGHQIANEVAMASTFDPQAVFEAAQAHGVDGIMTLGTDQPVLTAAIVATKLGLPSLIGVETAQAVTDKRVMKQRFTAHDLPTVPYQIFDPNKDQLYTTLTYPVVVKPVDSQGQRGIFQLATPGDILAQASQVLTFSRAQEFLIETYYPNDEVTVSGWVNAGKAHLLTLTDRISFRSTDQLGICLSHEWPSRYTVEKGDELAELTQRIVTAFNIQNGPIYFQFLIGHDGIQINEIACRIGGAFESQFIPRLTGFDITRNHIQAALGKKLAKNQRLTLDAYDFRQANTALSVQLFFANPCTICALTPLASVLACPGVIDAGYHLEVGKTIHAVDNATARVGYCIVEAANKQILESRLAKLYAVLYVLDENGQNQLIHRPLEVASL